MKVLIAEDEYCSRLNLVRQLGECLSLQPGEILEARNGREAWEIFLNERPELILTDIRMPVLDGIKLAEMIHQSRIPTRLIIVSGFAEFEYAQAAMKYGAAGYLLKPIQEKELLAMLKEQGMAGAEPMPASRGGPAFSISERLRQLITSTGEKFGWEGDQVLEEMFDNYSEILIWVNTREGGRENVETAKRELLRFLRIQNDVFCKAAELNGELWAVVMRSENREAAVRFAARILAQDYPAVEMCLGISGLGESLRDIREYHKQALYALSGRLFYPGRKVLRFDDLAGRMVYKGMGNPLELKQIKCCIYEGDASKALALIQMSFREMLKTENLSVYSIWDALKMVEIILNEAIFHFYRGKEGIRNEDLILENAHFELVRYPDAEHLLEDIEEKVIRVCRLAEISEEKTVDNTAQMVIDYIRENYNSDITLKDLAENVFFLNSSYLSHLLKSRTGKNYLTYLTEIRMEKAAELLKHSSLTVTEVAGMCGYNDISKFIQVFKKFYGNTPGKYRGKDG